MSLTFISKPRVGCQQLSSHHTRHAAEMSTLLAWHSTTRKFLISIPQATRRKGGRRWLSTRLNRGHSRPHGSNKKEKKDDVGIDCHPMATCVPGHFLVRQHAVPGYPGHSPRAGTRHDLWSGQESGLPVWNRLRHHLSDGLAGGSSDVCLGAIGPHPSSPAARYISACGSDANRWESCTRLRRSGTAGQTPGAARTARLLRHLHLHDPDVLWTLIMRDAVDPCCLRSRLCW